MKPFYVVSILLGLLAQTTVFAQYSESITSDRPGDTYSANTVGARVAQYQVGGTVKQIAFNDGFGNGLIGGLCDGAVRIGIIERMELGFAVQYSGLKREKATFNSDPIKSLGWTVNLRGNLLQSNGKTPNIGLLAEVIFPSADTEYFADQISQHFRLLIEQPLEKRIRLSTNIGMVRTDVAAMQYTLNLSVDISPIATIFVEHFGQYSKRYLPNSTFEGNPNAQAYYYVRANGGFGIRPVKDFQIDMQATYGTWALAPSEQKEWALSLGLSWRVRFKKRAMKNKETTNEP